MLIFRISIAERQTHGHSDRHRPRGPHRHPPYQPPQLPLLPLQVPPQLLTPPPRQNRPQRLQIHTPKPRLLPVRSLQLQDSLHQSVHLTSILGPP